MRGGRRCKHSPYETFRKLTIESPVIVSEYQNDDENLSYTFETSSTEGSWCPPTHAALHDDDDDDETKEYDDGSSHPLDITVVHHQLKDSLTTKMQACANDIVLVCKRQTSRHSLDKEYSVEDKEREMNALLQREEAIQFSLRSTVLEQSRIIKRLQKLLGIQQRWEVFWGVLVFVGLACYYREIVGKFWVYCSS